MILIVGISRALESDVYWVVVCFLSYVLYSSLFGLASELVDKYHHSARGPVGAVINVLKAAFSDARVITVAGLALSSHAILGAPFVPLYHVFPNLDLLEHFLSGVGVGLFMIKAYRAFIGHFSYSRFLNMIGLSKLSRQVQAFEITAELPFVCYSTVFIGLLWEALEEVFENFTPRVVNIFFWNGTVDVLMALSGAITAYLLITRFGLLKNTNQWRQRLSSAERDSSLDERAIREASQSVPLNLKHVIGGIYSEKVADDVAAAMMDSPFIEKSARRNRHGVKR